MQHASIDSAEILTMYEIASRYEGEWVLVKILEPTVPRRDAPGIVLAHGPDPKPLSKQLVKVHKREPDSLLTVMLGGAIRFGDGETLRRELARIAAEEEWVSVNPW
jgi:hypothetical protein